MGNSLPDFIGGNLRHLRTNFFLSAAGRPLPSLENVANRYLEPQAEREIRWGGTCHANAQRRKEVIGGTPDIMDESNGNCKDTRRLHQYAQIRTIGSWILEAQPTAQNGRLLRRTLHNDVEGRGGRSSAIGHSCKYLI
jgi:hypothetical protein